MHGGGEVGAVASQQEGYWIASQAFLCGVLSLIWVVLVFERITQTNVSLKQKKKQ